MQLFTIRLLKTEAWFCDDCALQSAGLVFIHVKQHKIWQDFIHYMICMRVQNCLNKKVGYCKIEHKICAQTLIMFGCPKYTHYIDFLLYWLNFDYQDTHYNTNWSQGHFSECSQYISSLHRCPCRLTITLTGNTNNQKASTHFLNIFSVLCIQYVYFIIN